jgi:hypothetical protein
MMLPLSLYSFNILFPPGDDLLCFSPRLKATPLSIATFSYPYTLANAYLIHYAFSTRTFFKTEADPMKKPSLS